VTGGIHPPDGRTGGDPDGGGIFGIEVQVVVEGERKEEERRGWEGKRRKNGHTGYTANPVSDILNPSGIAVEAAFTMVFGWMRGRG
jgi:hypothetical protein